MANRRYAESPRCLEWLGDLAAMRRYLQDKPWRSLWGPVKMVNSVLRSYGVVAFANNPLSGTLILAAMFVGNPSVGCAALLAGAVSVITSKLLGAPDELVCDGVTVFNSVLVGCVCTAVVPGALDTEVNLHHWLALSAAFVATCYMDLGLGALMAPTGLPPQSLAFNLVAAIGFLATRGKLVGHALRHVDLAGDVASAHSSDVTYHANFSTDSYNGTEEAFSVDSDHVVDWIKVMQGTVLAAGQVYGVGTMTSSILVWLAFLIYSPILSCCFYLGSAIGCIVGSVLTPGPLTEVYAGLWGYNSLLTAGGLSYFLQPSRHMLPAVLVGAAMAVLVQAAILPLFLTTQVPVMSYPFNVVITPILAIGTQKGTALTFLTDRSYHERHVYEYYWGLPQSDENDDRDLERNLRSNHT